MNLYQPTYTRDGVSKQSKVWWVRFRLGGQDVRKSTKRRDKTAALVEAAKIVKQEELKAVGAAAPEVADTPVADLVAEHVADLRRRNLSQKHVDQVSLYLDRMVGSAKRLGDVQPASIRKALAALQGSPSVKNRHLQIVRSFFTWLNSEGRWPRNPAKAIQPVRADDPEEKGAFSLTELRALLSAAPKRRLVYLCAATTGLRRSELKRLEWRHVQGDLLRIPGQKTKGKKKALIPLLPEVAEALEQARPANAEGNDRVFKSIPEVRTLRRDLKKAGLSPVDERGNDRVFHSLRVSLATLLAEANVPLTLAQRILRHSDPRLTSNVYTKHAVEAQREALRSLGSLLGADPVVSRPNVSHDSEFQNAESGLKSLSEQQPNESPDLTPCQQTGEAQTPEGQSLTEQFRGCLARCLALLNTCPANGLDLGWDQRAQEAIYVGERLLLQALPQRRGPGEGGERPPLRRVERERPGSGRGGDRSLQRGGRGREAHKHRGQAQ